MPLKIGARLGPYEILTPLGAGGMGEVYKARDTRLDRTVAIKVLPADVANDPDLRARFEREARAVAALSHPHICTLHDIGRDQGVDYLVMEHLDGETLADRLARLRGPLPLDQVLKIATEIADALDKAHRAGITHRDLKPANIMLTKSGAKLLDFGLAKLRGPAAPISMSGMTRLATTTPNTAHGTILGTVLYMSPEQVEGKDADARSDIWALGGVIYEAATGKRPFDGESPASIIGAILKDTPPAVSSRQPLAPLALDRVIDTCLAKDPDERWQSALDLRRNLQWVPASGNERVSATPRALARRERLAWGSAALLLALGLGALGWYGRRASPASRPLQFAIPIPVSSRDLALSPDGRTLVFAAFSESLGRNVLWVQAIGSRAVHVATATEGASYPFWSPDSRFVAFFADGKLRKMAMAGEAVQIICDAALGRGGSWNRDDVIVFSPEAVAAALYRVSASGGVPTRVTELDASRRETTHRWPLFLPDGRHFLFLAGNFSGETEGNAIYAGSLESPQRTLVTPAFSNVAYSPAGFILYDKANHLVGQAFDAQRLQVTGEPTVVADEVAYLASLAYAAFSTSNTGMLVYQASSAAGQSELTWFDRAGRKIRSLGDRREYANPRLSPDGKHVAVDVVDPLGNVDVFVVDPGSGQSTRFTFDAAMEAIPIWSPDGGSIAYQSFRDGPGNVYRKLFSGAALEEALLKLNVRSQPSDWSPDGAFVVYNVWSAGTGWDLWLLPIAGERKPRPFLQTKFDEDEGQFSPDGRWMAYTSNETGRREVYVSPFPGPAGKWQISSAGGSQPRWRRDGKELFYLSPDHTLMAVDVRAAATFQVGSATVLFRTRPREMVSGTDRYTYDVSLDGRQFLVNATIEQASPSPVSIVLDWAADLTKKE